VRSPAPADALLLVASNGQELSPAACAAAQWAALSWAVAGGGRTTGRMRVSRDGGRNYPRSRERDLTTAVPNQPAAVRLYDAQGDARCLVADLDVSRGGQHQVDQDLARLRSLVERCGGRAFTDHSPNGGRHLYLPLAQPVGYDQLRAVMLALAALLPSLDITPGVNLTDGCIRPPGARHKTGGWQRLDGPLSVAQALAGRPNSPRVWSALTEALRPQMTAQRPVSVDPHLTLPAEAAGAAGPKERLAAAASPVRPGGARPLRPHALAIATTGAYDPDRYATPSQARQAVLAAAAASGWTFPGLLEQLHSGQWPGLWSFYDRYQHRHRREALASDWLKALTYARTPNDPAQDAQTSHGQNSDTREPTTHRGYSPPSLPATSLHPQARSIPAVDGYQLIRSWWTAVRLAERDRYNDRSGHSRRLVLRALGAAAQKTGRTHLAFGVRSLAIATGMSRTTVGEVLQLLREEPDSLVVRLVTGRGLAGDLYQLRIPDRYAERARTDPWRPGRIEALHPAFRTLGVAAAFVYEALDKHPQSSWDLANTALIAVSTTKQALRELAAHGLAVHDRSGWTRGDTHPDAVARATGADKLVDHQVQRYRTERVTWRERLGLHPTVTLDELRTAPPAPAEPDRGREHQRWLPTQAQPPPSPHRHSALQLVLTVLGGTVITR